MKTSKAGDRATGEDRGTCRTRLRPISATPEREAGDIADVDRRSVPLVYIASAKPEFIHEQFSL